MPGKIVDPEEWRAARLDLLKKEKEHTKKADELASLRANMPMVKVGPEYQFTGAAGVATLSDLFQSRRQLIIVHMMFDPSWDGACKNCSFLIDQMPEHLEHLHARNTTLALVSRAPIEKLTEFTKRMGWTTPVYSSYGSMFNYDFHVTQDEKVRPVEWNYKDKTELEAKGWTHFMEGEQPGMSVFMKDGEDVYHSYSCYGRGADHLMTTCGLLDLTPLGRQDTDSDEDEAAGVQYHDEYQ